MAPTGTLGWLVSTATHLALMIAMALLVLAALGYGFTANELIKRDHHPGLRAHCVDPVGRGENAGCSRLADAGRIDATTAAV